MSENVPVDEAGTRPGEPVDRARGGEEIVLTEGGLPVVRLTPDVAGRRPAGPVAERGAPRRPLGFYRGRVRVADDFDDTPRWVIDAFEGIDSHLPPPDDPIGGDGGRRE